MILDFSKLLGALEAHTKALTENTAALLGGEAKKPRGRPVKGEETAAPVTAAATVAATVQSTPSVAGPAAATTAGAEPDLKPVKTQPTLQQVADAVVALANDPKRGGREAAVAILNKYGATKVPELKPENFQAALDEALAAGTAPASASSGLV
jgi:hypothetical protein